METQTLSQPQHSALLSSTEARYSKRTAGAQKPDAHETLWRSIKSKQLQEIVFRRNHVLGSITADYFAPKYHLVVGVNEPGVDSKHWYYVRQDSQLRHMGFRVLRFTHEEVERDIPFVLDSIVEVVSQIARRQRKI